MTETEHVSYEREWLDNVVAEVKRIMAELAKDTFKRYRQCGQVILKSGYRKGQWDSQHKKMFLEQLRIGQTTFSNMVKLGEMTEDEFFTVGKNFQSFHAWENRGNNPRLPCSRCGVTTSKGDIVEEEVAKCEGNPKGEAWVCDVCLLKREAEWDDPQPKKWFQQPKTHEIPKAEVAFIHADHQEHRRDYVGPVSHMDEELLLLSQRFLAPLGVKIEFQPDIVLVQAKPDLLFTLPGQKQVALYADGPHHLKSQVEGRDEFIRGWLKRRGFHVMPCCYKSFSKALAWDVFTLVCRMLESEFGLKVDLNGGKQA